MPRSSHSARRGGEPSPLLSVRGLRTTFRTEEGEFAAVEDVSFDLAEGEVLGIVGESGCGKSVTALSLLRLIPSPPGRIAAARCCSRAAIS